MNLNQRRPVSSPVRSLLPANRDTVVNVLTANGYELTTTRENVGEWNQCRNYVAVRGEESILLDVVMRGERPNWEGMLRVANGLSC